MREISTGMAQSAQEFANCRGEPVYILTRDYPDEPNQRLIIFEDELLSDDRIEVVFTPVNPCKCGCHQR